MEGYCRVVIRIGISRPEIDRLELGEPVLLVDPQEGAAVELWPAWKDYTGPTLVKSEAGR